MHITILGQEPTPLHVVDTEKAHTTKATHTLWLGIVIMRKKRKKEKEKEEAEQEEKENDFCRENTINSLVLGIVESAK